MLRFAKWHIWLGWLVGIPILMWMASGLFMAARPIEEVRGNHLRIASDQSAVALPSDVIPEIESAAERDARLHAGWASGCDADRDGWKHYPI